MDPLRLHLDVMWAVFDDRRQRGTELDRRATAISG